MVYEILKKLESYRVVKHAIVLDMVPPIHQLGYIDDSIKNYLENDRFKDVDESMKQALALRIRKYNKLITCSEPDVIFKIPLHILSCEKSNRKLHQDWQQLTTGKVEFHQLAGEHNFILQGEHVKTNAEIIKKIIK